MGDRTIGDSLGLILGCRGENIFRAFMPSPRSIDRLSVQGAREQN